MGCHDIGVLDQLRGPQGEQPRVAGAHADAVQAAWAHSSLSWARALIAATHRADPPRRPCTTRYGRSHGLPARASLDSVEPTNPTGIPMTAAGRGPPSTISSSRWNSAVGALPIATTAPARSGDHSDTAAAERVVRQARASSGTRGSSSRQRIWLSLGSLRRVIP